jgi:hypothetical protein
MRLFKKIKTMHEVYGDESNHKCCLVCGLCIDCGDCKKLHDKVTKKQKQRKIK